MHKKAEITCFIDKFSTIRKNTKIFKNFIYYEKQSDKQLQVCLRHVG